MAFPSQTLISRSASVLELEYDKTSVVDLAVGYKWDNIQTAKEDAKAWVMDKGESYKVKKSDQKRLILECLAADTCQFHLRIYTSQASRNTGSCFLTTYTPHTCPPNTHQDFSQRHASWYIARSHVQTILRNRRIKARDIVDNEATWRGSCIPAKQARRAIRYKLEQIDGFEEDSFALFPDYATELKRVNSNTYVQVKLHETTNAFQGIFIALGPLRQAICHLRHFLAVDGTHTRSKYRMILAVAVGIDANDEVLPVCWALMPQENEYWWSWFCGNMGQAFPDLKLPQRASTNWVVISDREKGLVTGIENTLPRINHIHCCQHIAENICARYGKAAKHLWWPIARATSPEPRQKAMEALRDTNIKAWEYVKALNTSTFLAYHISALGYSRFGHDTSNIVESVNGIWGEFRDMPPLIMLDNIHTWTMKRIAERQQIKVLNNLLAPSPWRKYNDRLAEARSYTVTYAGQNIFQVDTPRRHRQEVNLSLRTCSCLNFEDYQSPCSHAIACCLLSDKDPTSFFHSGYTLQAFRDTYKTLILPIIKIHNLKPNNQVKPPQIAKLRGRPRTKRIRKTRFWKISRQCTTCYHTGHNSRTCSNQPVLHGRAQRAQDRRIEAEDTEDADDSEDSKDAEDSDDADAGDAGKNRRINASDSDDSMDMDTRIERRREQEIDEEIAAQEQFQREHDDDHESLQSNDSDDSIMRYSYWRDESTQGRCVDPSWLEMDINTRKLLLPEVLNPIGRRLIGGRELSISEEGVLFRPWVEPRGRPIIDTIYVETEAETG